MPALLKELHAAYGRTALVKLITTDAGIGYSKETPTWRQVVEHFLLVLCASNLQTDSFDALA